MVFLADSKEKDRLTMYKDELFEKCRKMDLKIPPGVESEKTIRGEHIFYYCKISSLD